MTWKLAEAKNKFSEVFNKALAGDPQTVVRRGKEVVVVAKKDYDKLAKKGPKKKNFIEHLLSAPSFEGADLSRDKSPPRDIKF
jgi:prevent-host-death family protein